MVSLAAVSLVCCEEFSFADSLETSQVDEVEGDRGQPGEDTIELVKSLE